MFIDETEIHVRGGKGGSGVAAFLREKDRPWGGPAGGDGGRGGSVIFEASIHLNTLFHLHRRRLLAAKNGQAGANKNCSGKSGKDLLVKVPCGTIVRDRANNEVLCDLTQNEQRFVVAPGGKGGRGNQHFVTSTHQTPLEFEKGKPGIERDLHLELKLIADVGLIGLPNAGKSTLLSRVSAAHPKIAPYPFTTREPHLGIVDLGEYHQIVMADLPGLIEGAHAGAGLGDEFLKHVERTSLLLHLIDIAPPDGKDPVDNYRMIENELKLYSETLHSRPRLIVANKMDMDDADEHLAHLREALGADIIGISAATGKGLKELSARLKEWTARHKEPQKPDEEW